MEPKTPSTLRLIIIALCTSLVPASFLTMPSHVLPGASDGPDQSPHDLAGGVTSTSSATISGMVVIGPLCPVGFAERPCPVVDLSDRFLILPTVTTGIQIPIALSSDGGFEETIPAGTYIITLQPCNELGCSQVFPQEISLQPGSSTVLSFEIDTGIR